MTAPAWPPVFDGIGALVVRCDIDPEQLVEKIERHSGIGAVSWIAPKVNGDDIIVNDNEAETDAAILHCIDVWRALGLSVGSWIYAYGPPTKDTEQVAQHFHDVPDFTVYDVEKEYKTDEGAPADWPAQLVADHKTMHPLMPAAVTSYGAIPGYGNSPSSLDFGPFAAAGWPVLAQLYNGFKPGDEVTYATDSGQPFPGPYPRKGLHQLVMSLTLHPGMAVYRPESVNE
jgi:hypothetical protein